MIPPQTSDPTFFHDSFYDVEPMNSIDPWPNVNFVPLTSELKNEL